MTEQAITPGAFTQPPLSPEALSRLTEILGRRPTHTEQELVSVLWNETPIALRPGQRGHGSPAIGSPLFLVGPELERRDRARTPEPAPLAAGENPGAAPGSSAAGPDGAATNSESESKSGPQPCDGMGVCLELLGTGGVASLHGTTSTGWIGALCETAARAVTGLELALDRMVPVPGDLSEDEVLARAPWGILWVVAHAGQVDAVKRVFERRKLHWCEIGEVTGAGRWKVTLNGTALLDLPIHELADAAPVDPADEASREAAAVAADPSPGLERIPETTDFGADLQRLLAWPGLASKAAARIGWDALVPGPTHGAWAECEAKAFHAEAPAASGQPGAGPATGADANGPCIGVAMRVSASSTAGNPRSLAMRATIDAARSLACMGAIPVAALVTGRAGPQSLETTRGAWEACRALGIRFVGGDLGMRVSGTSGEASEPAAGVAVIGMVDAPRDLMSSAFRDDGDALLVLGEPVAAQDPYLGLGNSAYVRVAREQVLGDMPAIGFEDAKGLHAVLVGLIRAGGIKSARACAEGGLAVALAESCLGGTTGAGTAGSLGATVDLGEGPEVTGVRTDALWFGEAPSRVVVTCAPADAGCIAERARLMGVPVMRIGTVGGGALRVRAGSAEVAVPLEALALARARRPEAGPAPAAPSA